MDNIYITKSIGDDRSSYPFVVSDGIRTPFTDAVDDMVIYVDPSIELPLIATASILVNSDRLELIFRSGEYMYKAVDDSSIITNQSGTFSGYIEWNTLGMTILKSILLGGDVEPNSEVMVDVSVCRPYIYPPLSTIRINGVDTNSPRVSITSEYSVKEGEAARLDLSSDDQYDTHRMSELIIRNIGCKDDYSISLLDDTEIENDRSGEGVLTMKIPDHNIIIQSDPECDLRIITSNDGILLSEVSNDKL